MKCTNCGASIPRDLGACPQCGVFARTVEPRKKSRTSTLILTLLFLAVVAAAATYVMTSGMWERASARFKTGRAEARPHIVHDRPGGARKGSGATISEPEAIRNLQQSLGLKPDCVAIMSKGYSNGAYDLLAVNRCDGTRLGRWRVDGNSGAVSRRLPK